MCPWSMNQGIFVAIANIHCMGQNYLPKIIRILSKNYVCEDFLLYVYQNLIIDY